MRATPSGLRILYVAGSGRSGSTLLDRLLGELPGVVSTGELARVWENGLRDNRRCGCGQPFLDCAFWSAVGWQAYGGWARVDLDRALYLGRTVRRHRYLALNAAPGVWPAYRRRRAELCELVRPLYEAVAAVSGCPVVVDSSKELVYAALLRHAFPDSLRLVHLVRDGHGVAHSWTKVVAARSGGPAQLELDRYHPAHSALRWNGYNLALDALRLVGIPLVRLRYEDLIAAPVEQMRRVAAFAGVPVAASALSFLSPACARIGVSHTVAGNPMRFTQGALPLRLDEEWRHSMLPGHRRTVSVLAAPALLRYGYLSGAQRGESGD